MPRSDLHGRWSPDPDAEGAELLHRQTCAEMLGQLAAGTTVPYPYGDALYLLEALRPPAEDAASSAAGPGRRLARAMTRLLTRADSRHPMQRADGGDSVGGGRGTELPGRGVPA
jgi:hypothetical protein